MIKITTLLLLMDRAYTTSMSFFVSATAAPRSITANAQQIGLLLTGVLVVMVTAQLFSFEHFPAVIEDMWLPGVSDNIARVLAAVIVSMEVLSLPFLLRLQLSPAMRVLSMVLGWFVVAGWTFMLVWQNVTINGLTNNGLLGDTAALPVGWWSVCLMLGLAIAAGWASWGMWPLRRSGR
jgi:hypothetical protein